ncbi:peptide deformylase [Microlunatus speluncae]|uniref:peptide deformylase n=1 Tax=Microlunatus speluncae TaxID=2594267 RepID=UPI0012662F93|nr:peptide deformylase [Microlunatus speluncae]
MIMDDALTAQVARLLAGPRPVPIIQAGEPVLRRSAADYTGQLPAGLLAELLAAMRESMLAAPGVGLAAPQLGLGLRIAVIEDDADLPEEVTTAIDRRPLAYQVIINPAYTALDDERVEHYEGCLSVPGYRAVVARANRVRLDYLDDQLAPRVQEFTGWQARIVQHETDHLGGTLYLDRAELRSLTTADNHLAHWAGTDLSPARAALGF